MSFQAGNNLQRSKGGMRMTENGATTNGAGAQTKGYKDFNVYTVKH